MLKYIWHCSRLIETVPLTSYINNMTDFDELKQIKAQCLRDITEALPDYVNRLNSIDTRLLPYVEDAISNI